MRLLSSTGINIPMPTSSGPGFADDQFLAPLLKYDYSYGSDVPDHWDYSQAWP